MARFLCVSVLLFLSGVVRGSKYHGSAHKAADLLAERSQIDTHADVHLVKRAEAAAELARRLLADSDETVSSGFPDRYRGKPADTKSYSMDAVFGAFNGLLSKVQNCQRIIEANQIMDDRSTREIHEVVVDFEATLFQFQNCGPCYAHNNINRFVRVFSGVFTSLTSIFGTCRKYFPKYWGGFLKDNFGDIDRYLADFLTLCQSNGLRLQTFIPQTFSSFLGPAGMTWTLNALRKAGYMA